MKTSLLALAYLLLCLPVAAEEKSADEPEAKDASKAEKESDTSESFEDIVKKCNKIDGLFTLYQDRESGQAYLAVSKPQLDKEFIYFSHTVDGIVKAGQFRGQFRSNEIVSIRKRFQRLEFTAENTSHYFDPKSPLKRAAAANISPALLVSAEIVAEDKAKQTYLIKANDLFLNESLDQIKRAEDPENKDSKRFKLGNLNTDKTTFVGLKSYPKNTAVTVRYVFDNPSPLASGGDDVTDARSVSVKIQHTFIEMPKNDFRPRRDDPRIGFFTSRVNDMTSSSATPYRDVIQRWHLKKADPAADLSDPVEPIVWWIENTTPLEIRGTITQAVLGWNEAFEAAGFRNAIQVRTQPDDADWDADDIRYNVLRWTSSPDPPFGGYGPSFVNPRTGQILGADIMLEFTFLTNRLNFRQVYTEPSGTADRHQCTLGVGLHQSNLFGIHALRAAGYSRLEADELLDQAVYYLMLHEVGHTLGLMHNMRSSQLLTPEEVQDADVGKQRGLTGSVMDYPAINIAPPGGKQGLFYTTKPGPYDVWAIQYGYQSSLPDPAKEEERLTKLLARSSEPELAFGNDADDMRAAGKAVDPRVMIYDLSGDAIGYAEGRIRLAKETMAKIKDTIPEEGKSYQELRNSFFLLVMEHQRAAQVASRYVGGVYVDRSLHGQSGATQPFQPVSREDQQRAVKLLREHLFGPDAFVFPPELLRHLQGQRRSFEFFEKKEEPLLHDRVLSAQKSVLDHLLHPRVLARMTDSRLYGNEYSVFDLLSELTEAVLEVNENGYDTLRQNLQVEYVRRLIKLVDLSDSASSDAVPQSAALFQLQKVRRLLDEASVEQDEERAHVDHLRLLIDRALSTDSK